MPSTPTCTKRRSTTHLLGSIDLDGENFYYQNPLDERRLATIWHGCPCCVGNIPRTLLMLPTWTYAKDEDNLYVNLFVGSTVNVGDVAGTKVEVVQETDYPWSGDVSIRINADDAAEFGLKIRVPNNSVSELYLSTPRFKWYRFDLRQRPAESRPRSTTAMPCSIGSGRQETRSI